MGYSGVLEAERPGLRRKGQVMRVARYAMAAVVLAVVAALLAGAAAPEAKQPAAKAEPQPAQRTIRVVDVPLEGAIQERAQLAIPFGPQPKLLRDFTGSIRKAADDETIEALVIRLREPSLGFAKRQELMGAIGAFKASGKKVYAYIDSCTTPSYTSM